MTDLLRRHAGILARTPPLARWTLRALAGRTKIVYAHHVGPPAPHLASFGPPFTPERLDEHLTALARHFEFAPLSELLAENGDEGSSRRLAVTFDDGFDLIATGALEVLDAHGVKATTFVLPAMLDNRNLMWRNKLSAVMALRPPEAYVAAFNRVSAPAAISDASQLLGAAMRWDMARKDELADAVWAACDMPPLAEYLDEHRPYFTTAGLERWIAGGHDVGLHTETHPDCSRLDADAVRKEIVDPARRLCARLGVASVAFSYPFGRRCAAVQEALLAEAGVLRCALGIRGFSPRGTDPLRLERASIEDDLGFSVYGKALLGAPRST